MKIYTRTGDGGETGLFGGQRVPKDHARVEAYGTVDEANAVIGSAIAALGDPELGERLIEIQRRLFELGAALATPGDRRPDSIRDRVDEADISLLETWIDEADAELPPLKTFILPGGGVAAAALQHARAVIRRAERRVLVLVRADDTHESALRYLNRLSDYLFMAARLANRRAGIADQPWTPRER